MKTHLLFVTPGQVVEVEGPVLLLPQAGETLEEIPSVGQYRDARHGALPTSRIRVVPRQISSVRDQKDSVTQDTAP